MRTKTISEFEQFRQVDGFKKYLSSGKLTKKTVIINSKEIYNEKSQYSYIKNKAVNGVYWYKINIINKKIQRKRRKRL